MRFVSRALVAVVTASTLAACAADSTAPGAAGARSVTVSFSTLAQPSTGSLLALSAGGAATDSIRITRAQLVISRLELQKAGAAACDRAEVAGDDDRDDDRSEHECAELELSPTLVDLPVDSAVSNKLQESIPSGSYSALEARVGPVEGKRGAGSAAFLAAHPDFIDVSVRVEGTFNGRAFTYTGSPRAEIETTFNPPIVVDSGAVNVTLNADLRSWFRNRSGAYIDPSTANANGANSALVADNIKRSFKAFRDDDRNGHDDREGHGSGH